MGEGKGLCLFTWLLSRPISGNRMNLGIGVLGKYLRPTKKVFIKEEEDKGGKKGSLEEISTKRDYFFHSSFGYNVRHLLWYGMRSTPSHTSRKG
jgi:hypothetical protein